MLGGLAEFERMLIRARTGEGRERAKGTRGALRTIKKLSVQQRREAMNRIAAAKPSPMSPALLAWIEQPCIV
jgi:DNA invertase Pin-like site-specific DNA recombinase